MLEGTHEARMAQFSRVQHGTVWSASELLEENCQKRQAKLTGGWIIGYNGSQSSNHAMRRLGA
jgi:hypothetical protein